MVSESNNLPVKKTKRPYNKSKIIAKKKMQENNVIAFIEQFYYSRKRIPNISEMIPYLDIDSEEIKKLVRQPRIIAALERRGIDPTAMLSSTATGVPMLSPRQIAAANVMLNFGDRRKPDQKLADLGITPEEYQGWLQAPHFKKFLAGMADDVLDNAYPDANVALAQKVRDGNIPALRLFYDVTGKTNQQEVIKAKVLVGKILEAVQRHVTDPRILEAIAEEIQDDFQ